MSVVARPGPLAVLLIALETRQPPKLEVLVASLAISVVPARTLGSPTAGIGTELLAHRERIEVTRSDPPFERSPVPMGVRIGPTRAQFAHFPGECLKPETGWRMTQSDANRSTQSRENTGNFVDLRRF
jgi:hypothetical protein